MQQKFTLSDCFELFALENKARQFTEHTLDFYDQRLTRFVDFCAEQNISCVDEVRPLHIRKFFVSLQEQNLSPHYVHSFARAIKTFFNYCVRDELLDRSPFDRVQMPKLPRKQKKALTPAQVKKILHACKYQRDKALITFLLDSGVRASECIALNVGDIDMRTGAVSVKQGKGQKDRTTFISAKTRKEIKRYLAEREITRDSSITPLWVSLRTGKRLTYAGLSQIFKRLKKSVGIQELSAHALRRTYAITMLRGGTNIYVLAKLMGHSDISVLRNYLDILDEDMKEAHERNSPAGNLL